MKNKLVLSLGLTTLVMSPIMTVVSCGKKKPPQPSGTDYLKLAKDEIAAIIGSEQLDSNKTLEALDIDLDATTSKDKTNLHTVLGLPLSKSIANIDSENKVSISWNTTNKVITPAPQDGGIKIVTITLSYKDRTDTVVFEMATQDFFETVPVGDAQKVYDTWYSVKTIIGNENVNSVLNGAALDSGIQAATNKNKTNLGTALGMDSSKSIALLDIKGTTLTWAAVDSTKNVALQGKAKTVTITITLNTETKTFAFEVLSSDFSTVAPNTDQTKVDGVKQLIESTYSLSTIRSSLTMDEIETQIIDQSSNTHLNIGQKLGIASIATINLNSTTVTWQASNNTSNVGAIGKSYIVVITISYNNAIPKTVSFEVLSKDFTKVVPVDAQANVNAVKTDLQAIFSETKYSSTKTKAELISSIAAVGYSKYKNNLGSTMGIQSIATYDNKKASISWNAVEDKTITSYSGNVYNLTITISQAGATSASLTFAVYSSDFSQEIPHDDQTNIDGTRDRIIAAFPETTLTSTKGWVTLQADLNAVSTKDETTFGETLGIASIRAIDKASTTISWSYQESEINIGKQGKAFSVLLTISYKNAVPRTISFEVKSSDYSTVAPHDDQTNVDGVYAAINQIYTSNQLTSSANASTIDSAISAAAGTKDETNIGSVFGISAIDTINKDSTTISWTSSISNLNIGVLGKAYSVAITISYNNALPKTINLEVLSSDYQLTYTAQQDVDAVTTALKALVTENNNYNSTLEGHALDFNTIGQRSIFEISYALGISTGDVSMLDTRGTQVYFNAEDLGAAQGSAKKIYIVITKGDVTSTYSFNVYSSDYVTIGGTTNLDYVNQVTTQLMNMIEFNGYTSTKTFIALGADIVAAGTKDKNTLDSILAITTGIGQLDLNGTTLAWSSQVSTINVGTAGGAFTITVTITKGAASKSTSFEVVSNDYSTSALDQKYVNEVIEAISTAFGSEVIVSESTLENLPNAQNEYLEVTLEELAVILGFDSTLTGTLANIDEKGTTISFAWTESTANIAALGRAINFHIDVERGATFGDSTFHELVSSDFKTSAQVVTQEAAKFTALTFGSKTIVQLDALIQDTFVTYTPAIRDGLGIVGMPEINHVTVDYIFRKSYVADSQPVEYSLTFRITNGTSQLFTETFKVSSSDPLPHSLTDEEKAIADFTQLYNEWYVTGRDDVAFSILDSKVETDLPFTSAVATALGFKGTYPETLTNISTVTYTLIKGVATPGQVISYSLSFKVTNGTAFKSSVVVQINSSDISPWTVQTEKDNFISLFGNMINEINLTIAPTIGTQEFGAITTKQFAPRGDNVAATYNVTNVNVISGSEGGINDGNVIASVTVTFTEGQTSVAHTFEVLYLIPTNANKVVLNAKGYIATLTGNSTKTSAELTALSSLSTATLANQLGINFHSADGSITNITSIAWTITQQNGSTRVFIVEATLTNLYTTYTGDVLKVTFAITSSLDATTQVNATESAFEAIFAEASEKNSTSTASNILNWQSGSGSNISTVFGINAITDVIKEGVTLNWSASQVLGRTSGAKYTIVVTFSMGAVSKTTTFTVVSTDWNDTPVVTAQDDVNAINAAMVTNFGVDNSTFISNFKNFDSVVAVANPTTMTNATMLANFGVMNKSLPLDLRGTDITYTLTKGSTLSLRVVINKAGAVESVLNYTIDLSADQKLVNGVVSSIDMWPKVVAQDMTSITSQAALDANTSLIDKIKVALMLTNTSYTYSFNFLSNYINASSIRNIDIEVVVWKGTTSAKSGTISVAGGVVDRDFAYTMVNSLSSRYSTSQTNPFKVSMSLAGLTSANFKTNDPLQTAIKTAMGYYPTDYQGLGLVYTLQFVSYVSGRTDQIYCNIKVVKGTYTGTTSAFKVQAI